MSRSDVEQHIEQAKAEARAGRREAARQRLLEALKAAPNDARAARLLAQLNAADAPPQRPRRRRPVGWLVALGLVGLAASGTAAGLLAVTTRDPMAMPTELVLSTAEAASESAAQALTSAQRADSPIPADDDIVLTEVVLELAVIEFTTEPSLEPLLFPTNTPPQFNVVFPTQTPAPSFIGTNPPPPPSLPTSTLPFFAGLTVTPPPTNTPITFNFATATPSTRTPTAAAPTPTVDAITPLPTSTSIPEFVFGTDVPTPIVITPVPTNPPEFGIDPSGGGGAPPPRP
jgi:hypothetical protein